MDAKTQGDGMNNPKQKWIIEETWCEVIERFDSFVATREEAISAWEKCYERPFVDGPYRVSMVSGNPNLEKYWREGKHYSGFYNYDEYLSDRW